MKNISKVWLSSLNFLDNNIVNAVIIIILVLYSSNIFTNINNFVGNLYNFSVIRLVILLLIIYVTPKSPTIGILLAISYLLSINYSSNETFISKSNEEDYLLNIRQENSLHPMQEQHSLHPMQEQHSLHPMQEQHMMNDTYKLMSKNTVESFFPFDDNKVLMENNKVLMENNKNNVEKQNNKNNCLDTYIPHYESVGNVCDPTATFQNELNAQGLNSPEGFNSPDFGSPL